MLTEEELKTEDFIRLYNFVGFNSLDILKNFEKKISDKKDLDIHVGKCSFTINNNLIHFNNSYDTNEKGRYLNVDITKEKGNDLLNIILNLGYEGYDYSTGERYERRQASVSYTYEKRIVEIKDVKDEEYFNKLEETRNKQTAQIVQKLKK